MKYATTDATARTFTGKSTTDPTAPSVGSVATDPTAPTVELVTDSTAPSKKTVGTDPTAPTVELVTDPTAPSKKTVGTDPTAPTVELVTDPTAPSKKTVGTDPTAPTVELVTDPTAPSKKTVGTDPTAPTVELVTDPTAPSKKTVGTDPTAPTVELVTDPTAPSKKTVGTDPTAPTVELVTDPTAPSKKTVGTDPTAPTVELVTDPTAPSKKTVGTDPTAPTVELVTDPTAPSKKTVGTDPTAPTVELVTDPTAPSKKTVGTDPTAPTVELVTDPTAPSKKTVGTDPTAPTVELVTDPTSPSKKTVGTDPTAPTVELVTDPTAPSKKTVGTDPTAPTVELVTDPTAPSKKTVGTDPTAPTVELVTDPTAPSKKTVGTDPTAPTVELVTDPTAPTVGSVATDPTASTNKPITDPIAPTVGSVATDPTASPRTDKPVTDPTAPSKKTVGTDPTAPTVELVTDPTAPSKKTVGTDPTAPTVELVTDPTAPSKKTVGTDPTAPTVELVTDPTAPTVGSVATDPTASTNKPITDPIAPTVGSVATDPTASPRTDKPVTDPTAPTVGSVATDPSEPYTVKGRRTSSASPGTGSTSVSPPVTTTSSPFPVYNCTKPKYPPPSREHCRSRATFNTFDVCWKRFDVVKPTQKLCDPNFGVLTEKYVSRDRFTGAECQCNNKARGDGYNCFGSCPRSFREKITCPTGMECNLDKDGKPFCNCPWGQELVGNSTCRAIPNACESCKHFCHAASACVNTCNNDQLWLFSCKPCDEEKGYRGSTGFSCRNIDECAENKHECDVKAKCIDMEPLEDDDLKYKCQCPKGMTADPHGGTTCRPCINNNECCEQPGICGGNAHCVDTEGSYNCICETGFSKGPNSENCTDTDECKLNPCPKFSLCNNTIGSFECICIEGYKKENGLCIPDKDVFCKNCDSKTTTCELSQNRDSYSCVCKQNHHPVDKRSCKPNTFCDKAETNTCAPYPRANCTDRVDGSGFDCVCNEGYVGDGKKCEPKSICERLRPCVSVANTRCVDDAKEPGKKYKCVCLDGHARQVKEQDKNTAPCWPPGTMINNCTSCNPKTEKCVEVPGDASGLLRTCVCREGYAKGFHGLCANVNECTSQGGHNCDKECATCVDRTPDEHKGKMFECELLKGWKGNGTIGTCEDIVECDTPNFCASFGTDRTCLNTVGSFKCPCKEGYREIPGVQDCEPINYCQANYTCNRFSSCVPAPNNYTCVCLPGYKEKAKDALGKPICENINECEVGIVSANGTVLPACPDTKRTKCNDLQGGFECICLPGYRRNQLEMCDPIRYCTERLDKCDTSSTDCREVEGGYECDCKHGYEPAPGSNITCKNIDECTSTTKPHKCNPNSHCIDLPATYKCACDEGYEPEPETHAMRPFCKRIDPCKKMTDMKKCGVCKPTDTAPFYKCVCLPGSINYNDTFCIPPSYCDTESNKEKPVFKCPPRSECKNEQCDCERNYDWIRVPEPLTLEGIKARKGCSPESWCSKYTCKSPSKCRDTAPGMGECYCPEGYNEDEYLGCADINECKNTTIKCPSDSKCVNFIGGYKCECDPGYSQTSSAPDRMTNPKCESVQYCTLQRDNCTAYVNTQCIDTKPFFTCDCKKGYERNQTKGACTATQCSQSECVDINECKTKRHDCHEAANCTNTPGGFTCKCPDGYYGNGKVCEDKDECDEGTDKCDRESQVCVNLPGSYNCTCAKGYDWGKMGAAGGCEDIVECDSPLLNNCTDNKKLKCVNTPGSFYCICKPGYVMAVNGTCIDDDECLKKPCPASTGSVCKNTEGSYECVCLDYFRKKGECATTPKTCDCEDVPECTEGIIKPDGSYGRPCGSKAKCNEKEGKLPECVCQDGFEGDAKTGCTPIEPCKAVKCDAKTQTCKVVTGKPTCVCKDGYVPAGDKCIPNPCLKDNGGCRNSSACFADPKTGAARCICANGFILDDKNNCIPENVCKCEERVASCRSEVCSDKQLMMCSKQGSKPVCVCDTGYKYNAKTKKCDDINECVPNPCPPGGNCTNLPGSFTCSCVRGQIFDGKICKDDPLCSNEQYCTHDPNAKCKQVEKDKSHCVCDSGYAGTGAPYDQPCKTIDPCEDKKRKLNLTNLSLCPNKNEQPVANGRQCECECESGFRRSTKTPYKCENIDECAEKLFTCKATFVCVDKIGGYECKCGEFFKLNEKKTECVKDDKCLPNPCNVTTESCDWKTGKCFCKDGFRLDTNGTCVNIPECAENTYKCGNNTRCQDTIGSYECPCLDGYEKKEDGECHNIDECKLPIPPCNLNMSKCEDVPGSYKCNCFTEFKQNGPFDCIFNSTANCKACHKDAHCMISMHGVANCTCNLGFQGDGIDDCKQINECELGIDNCHKLANCTDLTPGFSCACRPPYEGDGSNVCELPPLCKRKYNDCPLSAECKALNASDANGNWVDCICKKGFVFNSKTRICEDEDECKCEKDPKKCKHKCPKNSECVNTEGSYLCNCPAGFRYNQAKNTCDDIDECKEGLYQEKCIVGKGRCNNTQGSWNCKCEPGYVNKKDDDQVCEKEYFCNTVKDDCDKNTTECRDLSVGFKCDCLSGLAHIPGTKKKCEDINECKLGTHNCSLDGSEQCINTWRSFYCNCTNGFTRDEKIKKCMPDNRCTIKKECPAYSICVMVPGKKAGETIPKCICETGYYFDAKLDICVVVPPCQNDFDCPSHSRCQVIQAQNKTGDKGTYECICDPGYEKIGHQCVPVKPCETKGVCGRGVCIDKLLPPFYECVCPTGNKQDNLTAPCKPLTCDDNVCTTHADCKQRENGGIYCVCKEGYVGLGTISSPCKTFDPCTQYTPCSRFATGKPNGNVCNCTCNEGYEGNGTWCKSIDVCKNVTLNDCDPKAKCVSIQGGHHCICPEGTTGSGKKGDCHGINECLDPALNKCKPRTTICVDLDIGYRCDCKEGYEKADNPYECKDTNECLNKTVCSNHTHTCVNTEPDYHCNCKEGFAHPDPVAKKTCENVNECLRTPFPCHKFADCEDTVGSYTCICKPGYIGDGVLTCTVEDICQDKKKKNRPDCDSKSTVCKMLPDKPVAVCECVDGYEPATGQTTVCNEIDRCEDGSITYDPETTNCVSGEGKGNLTCKEGYTPGKTADGKNMTCVDKDECAVDPAYAESMKKISLGQNKGTWKEWMVPPKDNSSGYALCYYGALANVSFSLQAFSLENVMPFCVNTDAKTVSSQTRVNPKIRGFECTCPPPGIRSELTILNKISYTCPNPQCGACDASLNYECVSLKCQCKSGHTARVREINGKNTTACDKFECADGLPLPPVIVKKKLQKAILCVNDRYVPASSGWKLVRDNATGAVIDVVDIDECTELPDACCSAAAAATCVGPNCVKCKNTPGSFECGNPNIVCGSYDKNTCQCQELSCTTTTSWFYSCNGPAPLKLATDKRVCSRILDMNSGRFMSFDSVKALFEYSAARKCDCCFLEKQPDDITRNPFFNYYGPCLDDGKEAAVVCEAGAKAVKSGAGPACPIRAKAGEGPKLKVGVPLNHEDPDPEMCEPIIKGKFTLVPMQSASGENRIDPMGLSVYDL